MRDYNEFKKETDREFKEGDYIFKKAFVRGIIILVLIVAILGGLGLGYKKIYIDANRQIFKHSITYTESAAQFLAKEYKEYQDSEDETDRNSIMEYVRMRYPNLDSSEIENRELRNFYSQCLKGGN